mgnify:CR=1 FL=1
MKKLVLSFLTLGACFIAPITYSGQALAADDAVKSAGKSTVKVPAMRNRVYTQLARAQKVADDGDRAGGLAILDEVKERIDSMNSYEQAMLWNFYGFMYYADENISQAIASFENVVAQEAIPESLRLSTLYSLAQLSMQQGNFQQTIAYLDKWQNANTKPLTGNQLMFLANVHYQAKDYKASLISVNKAIALVEAKGEQPKENWLILQRANYYELKQPEKVTQVLEQLVRLYSKPEYWVQLAGMYGEIGQEDKQLAIMESAWQAGYITSAQQLVSLAQLYRYHGVPYKAANLLEKAIDQGEVVANERHLEMIAMAYMAAKDDKKAIPALQQASKIAENGKFDAQLAQSYLNLEQWQDAIDAAEKAIERGGVKRIGDMHLVQGMSHFHLKQFAEALDAFSAAQSFQESAKTADQWFKYVKREQGQYERLAMLN